MIFLQKIFIIRQAWHEIDDQVSYVRGMKNNQAYKRMSEISKLVPLNVCYNIDM